MIIEYDAAEEIVEALAALPTTLDHLTIRQRDFDPHAECESEPALDGSVMRQIAARAPRLERLELVGHDLFETLEHPSVRELSLRGLPLCQALLDEPVDLPSLISLSWHHTEDIHGVCLPPESLDALFDAAGLGQLERLDVGTLELDGDLLAHAPVFGRPLIGQLSHLALPSLHGSGLAALLAHAAEARRLRHLSVGRLADGLDLGALERAIPELVIVTER